MGIDRERERGLILGKRFDLGGKRRVAFLSGNEKGGGGGGCFLFEEE